MSAPQIVHVETVVLDGRTYTVSVVRVAGGLAGQWHCPCGAASVLQTTHVTVEHAVRSARSDLEQHHIARHAGSRQP
jgi:hypothetical protein